MTSERIARGRENMSDSARTRFLSTPADDALAELDLADDDFVGIDAQRWPSYEHLHHAALSAVHAICLGVLHCEESGCTRDEIVDVLRPVRDIHARSPFVARLQQWPRGYPGDFETVEYLCSGANRATEGTIEHACEAYALSRSIAQQHRNKVQHQASRILRTMIANPRQTRIASLACGGCPDFRRMLEQLPSLAGDLWLNDGSCSSMLRSEE